MCILNCDRKGNDRSLLNYLLYGAKLYFYSISSLFILKNTAIPRKFTSLPGRSGIVRRPASTAVQAAGAWKPRPRNL